MEVNEDWIGEDGQFDSRLVSYELEATASPEAMEQARDMIAAACRPLPRKDFARELTKTAASCIPTRKGLDLEGWMEVMIEDLAEFPGEVVMEALKRWRRREKFLPTVAELVDDCQWLGRKRAALRRWCGQT